MPENIEPRHILSSFDKALVQLRGDLTRMAVLAEDSFNRAARALSLRDADLCNSIIAEDDEIDELEKKVDAEGIHILTKFGPLAHDFRRVFATMKASTDLERISDKAVSIARRSKRLMATTELAETRMLEPLFAEASAMLADAVRAFVLEDEALGKGLKGRDKMLDLKHHDFIERITRRMEEDPANAQSYLSLVLIARFIERVGDHAVNIGEDCIYSSSAKDVRHEHSSTAGV
jgi:phosphate transport system protein